MPDWYLGKLHYQIQEQCDSLHGTILLKVTLKELSSFHVNSHGRKYNSEVVILSLLLIQKEKHTINKI
jgi:hypothetical protein